MIRTTLSLVLAIGLLAGCSSADSSESISAGSSEAGPDSFVVEQARLPAAFYESLIGELNVIPFLGYAESGTNGEMEIVDNFSSPADIEQALSDDERAIWPLAILVKMEGAAAEAGAATPFDLAQYTEDGISYSIPVETLHDAILAWYQVDFDFTTLHGDPSMATTAYYEDGVVHLTIDGLGGPAFYTVDSIDVQHDNGISTVSIVFQTTYDKQSGEFLDEPAILPAATIKMMENADGTYTLLSFDNLPF